MNKPEASQNVIIKDRKSLFLTGITDVLSFDERSVLLSGVLGMLSIEGEELHIQKMNIDVGELQLDGRINGIMYIDREPRKSGLFGKRK